MVLQVRAKEACLFTCLGRGESLYLFFSLLHFLDGETKVWEQWRVSSRSGTLLHAHSQALYVFPFCRGENRGSERWRSPDIANGRAGIWLQTWLNCKAHSFFHFIIYMFSTKNIKGSELFKENEREDNYMKIFIGMCIVNVNKWF